MSAWTPAAAEHLDQPGAVDAGRPVDPAGGIAGGIGGTGQRRAWRRWALILGAVLAAAAVLSWRAPAGASDAAYHPQNPTANGAQAIARVLAAQGVEVVVVEGQAALLGAGIDRETTLVIANTTELREPTLATVAEVAAGAERLVLIRPDRRVVRALVPAVGMRDAFRQQADLVSVCDNPDVRPDERLSRSQSEYSRRDAVATCFVNDDYGVYLRTSGPGLAEVVLIGSVDVIANDRVAQVDNAAVALRALGHSPRLLWYVPDLRDVPPSAAEQAEDFTPPWWGSMLMLLFLATLATMWWRGRRFGRLVTEPLPVVIRAVETTESRGRMYRKARDSQRASAVLRDATRRRLAAYLGLPAAVPVDALAEATAAATRHSIEELRWLLGGLPTASDADLLALAARLTALEKEIRRS
ncbi:MAG: DUF4350 domain-containing protein [Candidatus Phosphoribacter sp.]|nr:hypothetical protein [Actinomycetales bacterium]